MTPADLERLEALHDGWVRTGLTSYAEDVVDEFGAVAVALRKAWAEVERLQEEAKHSFTLEQITSTMQKAIAECAQSSTPMPRRQRKTKATCD